MKISAFQIKNYRSIVDSDKCYLSPDNITALIGQNESGKTSVLEALKSFYEGIITDDVLRSDLTFPEITCVFLLDENKTLGDYIDIASLPAELRTAIYSNKEIAIKRKWLNARKSNITIDVAEIVAFYELLESRKNEITLRIASSVPELVKLTEVSSREMETSENAVAIARNDLNTFYIRSEEIKRTINKAKKPDVQITAEQELITVQQQLSESETNLKEKLILLEEKKAIMQQLAEKLSICKSFNELSLKVLALTQEADLRSSLVDDAEHQYELCSSEKEIRLVSKRIEQLKQMQTKVLSELKEYTNLLSIRRRIADRMLVGKRFKEAENEAVHEHEIENNYSSLEELGNTAFKIVPMFEFFEDFSSLLPNKIDLEDLLNENIHAEGYKAARNFLCVAGLNADFFREKNHRILKQKIENLNSEITVDFQDYWRQNVGKNDKIRINFELEHYDNSQPEKSGKPYLEFWIKDKQERLYPKQRSRGVRWFLSFYLELKATAKSNTVNRVMLIDEPGLSLHARAQEDVLKVFEDLRDHLQIIYCTHSPNLIDIKKLYRIIAVQRAKVADEKSETVVLDARSLNEASADTLSPIYSLMGTRLNDRQFIFPKNNLIVEDAVTFHYLDAMSRLYGFGSLAHFIPSSGSDHIPMMANILFGWKLDFGLLVMDNPANKQLIELLKATTFFPDPEASEKKIKCFHGFSGIEDLFSTIDFKKFVIQQRVGITVRNTEYIESNNLSRIILSSDFCSKLHKESTQFTDFDEETKKNFEKLFRVIKDMTE
jgi:predicted ATP-dependent endonuclease of OLD family